MAPANTFVCRCTDAPLLVFVVSDVITIVGRSSGCDYVLDHPSVSRRHAQLWVEEGQLHVQDLGSRNGTFVEGQRVQGSQILPQQVLRLGHLEFSVSTEEYETPAGSLQDETDNPSDVAVRMRERWQRRATALSDAQQRVFQLLLDGLTEKAISQRLHLSPHTVHSHTQAIFRAYGVHSRGQLLAATQRPGTAKGRRR